MSTQEGEHKKNKQAFEAMQCLRRNNQLCDVILIADDVNVYAHKVVLASRSLYFHAKFVIARTGDSLPVKGITGRILELLVDYMYTSKLHITAHTVRELLVGSKLLMLREAGENCCEYIKYTLSPTNCFDTVEWATLHNLSELKSAAEEYISQNLLNVIDQREFLVTSYENLLALLISAKSKCVSGETLMDAISVWICYDMENRKLHLDALLDDVEMSSISPNYLMRKLDDPLFKDSLKYMTKAMEIIRSQYLQGGSKEVKQPEESPVNVSAPADITRPKEPINESKEVNQPEKDDNTRPTEPISVKKEVNQPEKSAGNVFLPIGDNVMVLNPNLFVGFEWGVPVAQIQHITKVVQEDEDTLVVAGHQGPLGVLLVEKYSFKTRSWNKLHVNMHVREGAAITFLGTKLYLISGLYHDTVDCYDLVEKRMSVCQTFPGRRGNMGVTTLNNSIYAVGGSNGLQDMVYNTAKVYRQDFGVWQVIKSMQMTRENPGFGVLNDKLYVVGGHDGDRYLKHVEKYDPVEERWCPMKNMTFKRESPGVAALDGKLYVIGGCDSESHFLNTVETFNPQLNQWTLKRNMRIARAGAGVIASRKRIYVIGGRNGSGTLRSVEMYDPQKDYWTVLPDMIYPKENVATTILKSSLL